MDLKDLKRNWDEFGKSDPLWAILTEPSKRGKKWDFEEFFKTGENEIESTMKDMKILEINFDTSRALDFGCGVGRLTQALASYFDEVYGIDISNTMIELANKLNNHGGKCKYFVNAVNDLRLFADESFTFVLSLITLQHIEPQYSMNYIREFARVLKPGGILVFQLPSEPVSLWKRILPKQLRALLIKLVYMGKPYMEMHGIEVKHVVELLQSCGMKILNIQRDQAAKTWASYRYYVMKKDTE